jgi:5-oxoprolinase (ATP-hydrolysing)
VTDANLCLGRLIPQYFPSIFGETEDQPLDVEASSQKFKELCEQINADTKDQKTPDEIASGFLRVANESICRPIRSLTEARGYDVRSSPFSFIHF